MDGNGIGWGNDADIKAFQSAYGKGLSRDSILGKNTAAAMQTSRGSNILNGLMAPLNTVVSQTVQESNPNVMPSVPVAIGQLDQVPLAPPPPAPPIAEKQGFFGNIFDTMTGANRGSYAADQQKGWQKYLKENNLTYVPANASEGKLLVPAQNSFEDYTKLMGDYDRQRQQTISNVGGLGLGAVQGITGVMSYLENRDMNKKNMELMNQQIANNKDIMSTRTARAADIKKYFG